MSTNIDRNIVEMRFENDQFEQGISQSIASLDKLQTSLSFGNNSLSSINTAVEFIAGKFSTLGIMAVTALQNITNQAISTGTQLVKSLTVDQISAGWGKYVELTKSTQTIMAATRQDWEDRGEQMEYVNAQLDKLNWFTDETSYNLVDMTSNIGKFTSAGVDLDKATDAMMGVATWAGLSGASSEQASRAMYNLSQAMGQGALKVQDWMSIENANMATEEFKNIAIKTAYELGTLKKASDGSYYAIDRYGKSVKVTAKELRSTLSAGWFTGDVITATLKKYGDFANGLYTYTEKTGLTATQMLKYIDKVKTGSINLNNSLEMSKLARDLQVDVGDLTDALSELSSEYNDLGYNAFKASQESTSLRDAINYTKDAASTGWAKTFKIIFGDYLESKELWTAVAEEMYDVFLEDLDMQNNVLKKWGDFGGREVLLEGVEMLWNRIKSTIMAIKEAFKEVFPPTTGKRLLEFTEKFRSLEYVLSATEWKTGKLKDIFTGIFNIAKNVGYSIESIFGGAKKALENLHLLPKDAYREGEGIIDFIGRIVDKFESLSYIFRINKTAGLEYTSSFEKLFSAVQKIAASIGRVFSSIGEAFIKIFPPSSKGIIADVISLFAQWVDKIEITDEKAVKLERALEGLFAIVDIIRMLIMAVLEAVIDVNDETGDVTSGIFDIAASIGDWIVSIRDWLKEHDTFKMAIMGFVNFIKSIPKAVDQLCQDLFGIGLDEIWENIKNAASAAWSVIKEFFTNLPTYAEQASQALFGMSLEELWENIKQGAQDAWDAVRTFFQTIKEDMSAISPNWSFSDFLQAISNGIQGIKDAWEQAKPYIDELKQMLKDNIDFELPTAEETGDALVKGGIFAYFMALASAIKKLVDFFTGKNAPVQKVADGLKYMFTEIGDAFKTLQGRIKAGILKTVATAILEIAAAIFILCLLPQDKMIVSAGVIAFMMGELALAMALISRNNTNTKKLKEIRKMLKLIEVILATIVGGIALLATKSDVEDVYAAGIMISLVLAVVALMMKELGTVKFTEKQATAMATVLAVVAKLIVSIGKAIKLASFEPSQWTSIAAAGVVIGTILGEILLFMTKMDKVKVTEKKAAVIASLLQSMIPAILAIGAAIGLITLASNSWEEIAAAGVVLAGMLFAVAGALKIMPDNKKVKEIAGALVVVSLALVLIAVALAIVAKCPLESLGEGVIAIGAMIAAVGIALNKMGGNSDGMLKASAALLIASVGLIAMAYAISIVAQVAESGYGFEALILLAGGLFALVMAATACQNPAIQAALYAIGVAMALIGVGALAAGYGMNLFADAVSKLVAAGPEGVTILIQAIKDFFAILPDIASNVVASIGNFIDEFVATRDKFLNGFKTFFLVILEAIRLVVPKIIQVIKEIAISLLQAARELLPELFAFLTELFFQLNDFIWTTAPELVSTVIMLVRELLRSIVELTPDITAAFFTILIDTLTQIKNNIGEITALLTEIALETILGTIDGLTAELPHIMESVWNFFLGLINSFADGVEEHAGDLRDAIINLCTSLINAVKEFFGIESPSTEFADIGVNLIQGLIEGITSMGYKIWEKITKLAKAIIDWFKEKLGINSPSTVFDGFGVNIVQGLINGIGSMFDKVRTKVEELGRKVIGWFEDLLEINSPSKVFTQFGKFIDMGLVNGLEDYSDRVGYASEDVGQSAIDSMSNALSGLSDFVNDEMDADPTIRPVLDLTDVANGINTMDGMLDSNRSIGLAAASSADMNRRIVAQNNNIAAIESLRASLSGMTTGNTVNQNNTFNISGDDPKAIAEEVNNILQNQIDRKDAVWA